MKNISKIVFACLILILSACSEDFLNVKQITSKTTENYYSTPAEMQEALVGCYDALQVHLLPVMLCPIYVWAEQDTATIRISE
jgi:hypothetical protein